MAFGDLTTRTNFNRSGDDGMRLLGLMGKIKLNNPDFASKPIIEPKKSEELLENKPVGDQNVNINV